MAHKRKGGQEEVLPPARSIRKPRLLGPAFRTDVLARASPTHGSLHTSFLALPHHGEAYRFILFI